MSFSEAGYICRTENAEHATEDPVDTLRARTIANNLAHLADQSAQVIVNWNCADGAGVQRVCPANDALGAALWQSPPFPLRFRPDGQSYRIRLRLRGRALTDSAAFWVTLDGAGSGATTGAGHVLISQAAVAPVSAAALFETSSSSGAWLTPDDDGVIHHADSRETTLLLETLDELAGRVVVHNSTYARISVNAYRLANTPTVELTGLYAAEYVGP